MERLNIVDTLKFESVIHQTIEKLLLLSKIHVDPDDSSVLAEYEISKLLNE